MPSFIDSPIPPHLDLTGTPSQLFQPPTPSASSALYRSISFSARKRSRAIESFDDHHHIISSHHHLPPQLDSEILPDFDYFSRPSRYRDLPRPFDASVESLSDASSIRRKRSRRDPSLLIPPGSDEKVDFPVYDDDHDDGSPSRQLAPVRWSRAVLGVVGKVWEFCWSGAFRGFYAGGGPGYVMTVEQGSSPTEKKPNPLRRGRESTPVPGDYPEDGTGEEAIRQNWVMVSSRDTAYDDEASGSSARARARRVHRRTTSGLSRRRLPSNRKLVSSTVPSSMTTKSQFSSPAKPRETPVSVETQRYMAQKRRMEREEDASLRRLNRQLQAMIKEGKQALGTQVEVDDFMEE
ncbi:hypothetical protein EYZ11_003450 [Aspergillus tanneri]|uniref:Uncharacterized protein n=1 Tax=Aspergillus tanneri TaxID=1220188 RepID=A0A4S3JNB5_9EURO|nr:hypothetical protein EYZ11_003450 [Aspergillus tanneri]